MEHIELNHTGFEKPRHDYLRVSIASPEVAIADIPTNVRSILTSYENAKEVHSELVVLPELCLTGYSTADLFHTQHVLEQSAKGLLELAAATDDGPALVVGAPLFNDGLLYNCGFVLAEGRIAGVVPKSYLPNYKEFYERRWFTSGRNVRAQEVMIDGLSVPFGTDLLFDINGTTVGVEICEDAWAPITPSAYAALAGAEIIVNLSASNELIGKTDFRRRLVTDLAAKLLCAYVYSSSGQGESVADVVYGGHQMIAEPNRIVEEHLPHSPDNIQLVHDIDRTYLQHDRLVNKTWAEQASEIRAEHPYRTVNISVNRPDDDQLRRLINPHPFVPADAEELDNRCMEIYTDMAAALAQRIREKDTKAIVLGLSGGLDSTLALLTAKQACDILGKPYDFIHTLTMPAKASSERTQDNADILANAIGTTHHTMPIDRLAGQLLEMVGHDQVTEDLTYENTQARIRTALLMNYANMKGGLVQGTGDMSENAIGWCTYNGDHMSMYNTNTSIPKTLVSHLVGWYAQHRAEGPIQTVLEDIISTPISPELTGTGNLTQTTEDIVGPYELNDFYMYEHLRHGSRPDKIGYLAVIAFGHIYEPSVIARWLDSFLSRHTTSQWKRDVMPNGPKVGSVSLSPRGDLRMAPNTSPQWYK